MNIIVLGAGLVGGPMAIDLAADHSFDVTAVDVSAEVIGELKSKHPEISVIEADLSDPATVTSLVEGYDLVLNAVPGFLGFETLEAVLKALWPSDPQNLSSEQQSLGIRFFDDTAPHGDTLHRDFLRGTPYNSTQPDRQSLLVIVMITDEEDCSAGAQGNLDFLEHPNSAPPGIRFCGRVGRA